jgi:hypothetical protein
MAAYESLENCSTLQGKRTLSRPSQNQKASKRKMVRSDHKLGVKNEGGRN